MPLSHVCGWVGRVAVDHENEKDDEWPPTTHQHTTPARGANSKRRGHRSIGHCSFRETTLFVLIECCRLAGRLLFFFLVSFLLVAFASPHLNSHSTVSLRVETPFRRTNAKSDTHEYNRQRNNTNGRRERERGNDRDDVYGRRVEQKRGRVVVLGVRGVFPC